MINSAVTFFSLFIISFLATWAMRAYAIRSSLLDNPNDRSLHTKSTPRGGGIGIVVSLAIAFAYWFASGGMSPVIALVFPLALGMAALGFWDDRVSLSARVRFLAQIGFSLLLLAVLQHLFGQDDLARVIGFELPLAIVWIFGLLFIVWLTNLFNFMDGSDGIAGVQALTTTIGMAVAARLAASAEVETAALLLAGASAGFLILNWQPAKIFMGDVGSIFLGFLLAAFIFWTALAGVAPFAIVLLLQGAFVVDATVTLVRRLKQKKAPHVAHRSHAYQRLVQLGWTHSKVALLYGAINLFWLLPVAVIGLRIDRGSMSPAISASLPWLVLFVAWLPLAGFAIYMRAGDDIVKQAAA